MRDHLSEFPEYPSGDLPTIPTATPWVDTSWHNDTCPSWRCGRLHVWVDFKDPERRESSSLTRFAVVFHYQHEEDEPLLETDDWDAVCVLVNRQYERDFRHFRSTRDTCAVWRYKQNCGWDGVDILPLERELFQFACDEGYEELATDTSEVCVSCGKHRRTTVQSLPPWLSLTSGTECDTCAVWRYKQNAAMGCLGSLQDLGLMAFPYSDSEWGSERQLEAENTFYELAAKRIGPDRWGRISAWLLKATSDEGIAEVLSALSKPTVTIRADVDQFTANLLSGEGITAEPVARREYLGTTHLVRLRCEECAHEWDWWYQHDNHDGAIADAIRSNCPECHDDDQPQQQQ